MDDPIPENDPSSTVLDLTSCQLHDLGSVELPPGLIELDLTANRLSSLDPRIGGLSCLNKLSLQQNLIDDAAVEPLSGWTALCELQELVLRDNKLTKIPDASIFKKLVVFDVSFNEISMLSGLLKVTSALKELYVSKNEVAKMEEIDHFFELQILELGSNRLRVMENLQNLTNLQELWLGRNRIKSINLCGLQCIKKISLQSNRLTSMVGLQECIALEELYLSHNGISKMEGLSSLVNLRVLDVSSNKIQHIEDIQQLTRLEDLWLNDNRIESLDTIAKDVAGSREKLTTIYIGNNPCVKDQTLSDPFELFFSTEKAKSPYLALLKEIFPNLQQIDSETFS